MDTRTKFIVAHTDMSHGSDLQVEVSANVAQFVEQLDENGHRLVVRAGYRQAREVLTVAGAAQVEAAQVNDAGWTPIPGNASPGNASFFGVGSFGTGFSDFAVDRGESSQLVRS